MFQELDKEKKRENETIFTPVLGRGRKKKKKVFAIWTVVFYTFVEGRRWSIITPTAEKIERREREIDPQKSQFFLLENLFFTNKICINLKFSPFLLYFELKYLWFDLSNYINFV